MKKNYLSIRRKIVYGSKFYFLPLLLLVLLSFKSKDERTSKSALFATNTLRSTSSGIWNVASNWSLGVVPTAADDVIIDHNDAALDTDVVVNSLTINSGKKLTIKYPSQSPSQGGSLTVNTVINNGTLVIEGSGTLVVNGTTSGTGTTQFKRANLGNNWRFLASPLKNVQLATLISSNAFAQGTGSHKGIAFFDNMQPNLNDSWIYQTNASTGTLSNGKAFAAKLDGGVVTFQGQLPNYQTDTIQSIQKGISSGYNLVGNPFTSYIPANSGANSTNNILTVNSSILSEETLWFWQYQTQSYFPFNHSVAPGFHLATMQGFFVHINPSLNTAEFVVRPSMQRASYNDNLVKNSFDRPEITLSIMNQDKKTRIANIYYIEGTTKGFDNGYDSTVFSAGDTSFSIYTHLVDDNEKHFAIQSLPNNEYESMIIPVGIHAAAHSTLHISGEVKNFPEGISVYLQDVVTNTFINLSDRKEPYTLQITEALEGKGRFYIHTTQKDPNQLPFDGSSVSVFTSGANSLDIIGLMEEEVALQLYDIRGAKVYSHTFMATGNDRLSIPTMAKGFYVASINTSKGIITKKILLEK